MAEKVYFNLGQKATLYRVFTREDIEEFAALSGDKNPIHIDDEYSRTTRFGGVIVHGVLVLSLISTLLGTQLPGPGSIYISQAVKFVAPVYPGDHLTASVEVIDWDSEKGRVRLLTEVFKDENIRVVTGEALLVMSTHLK